MFSARKFAENKYAMKIHTRVCEQLKILRRTENERDREKEAGGKYHTRDSKFNSFSFNRAVEKSLNQTINFEQTQLPSCSAHMRINRASYINFSRKNYRTKTNVCDVIST